VRFTNALAEMQQVQDVDLEISFEQQKGEIMSLT
jgi:hypothetical protein